MATMNPATATGVPYYVPPEPSRLPSIMLAAVVHAGLLLFLWAGVSWQNTEPVAVEAEVWDMKVQSAAAPPLPEQAPEPEPPAPTPKVVEQPVERPPEVKPPDIALEQEKLKAEKLKKELAEKKLAELKQKQKDELLEKKKLEKEAADKKLAEKKAKEQQLAAEKKQLDKLRDLEMKRILGAAGAAGDAQKATSPRTDSDYLAGIVSKIKSTTSYLGNTDVPGNPRVVFRIQQLPTGEIISVKKIKSSGLPEFDDAVEKGIIKASPLKKKKDGTVEPTLEIGFSMKDLN
jgi:colicin import membrane protein